MTKLATPAPIKTKPEISDEELRKAQNVIFEGTFYIRGALGLADIKTAVDTIQASPLFSEIQRQHFVSKIRATAQATATVMICRLEERAEWLAADEVRKKSS